MPAGCRGGNRRCLPIVIRCVSAGSQARTTTTCSTFSWQRLPWPFLCLWWLARSEAVGSRAACGQAWAVRTFRASVMSRVNLLYLHGTHDCIAKRVRRRVGGGEGRSQLLMFRQGKPERVRPLPSTWEHIVGPCACGALAQITCHMHDYRKLLIMRSTAVFLGMQAAN